MEDGVGHWWAWEEQVEADRVGSTKKGTESVNSVHYYGYGCTYILYYCIADAVLDTPLDFPCAWLPGVLLEHERPGTNSCELCID